MARGSVHRRGGTWAYVLDVGVDPVTGRRRQQQRRGFRTRKLAEAALRELIVALETSSFAPRSKATIGEYLDEWLTSARPRLRDTTFRSYQVAAARVRNAMGAVPVQAVTPLDLEALYAALARAGGRDGRPLSAKSVANTHIVLRKALGDAERLGLVARNPARVAKPPRARRAEQRTWSGDDLRRFLESARSDRLYPLFLLLATTGMRRGEALGLRWQDVDFKAGRVAVVQTITTIDYQPVVSAPKTARSRRSVSLDAATLAVLRDHRRAQAADRLAVGRAWEHEDFVFADEIGRPLHPERVSATFRRRVHAAGLPDLRLHDLRHTHATLALQAGVHPKIVSERLGHSTVGITLDLYSHVAPSLDADAAAVVARQIFDGPHPR